MNKDVLQENRIFYVEELSKVPPIPRHASYLRSALLDFDCTVSDRFGFDEDIRDFDWERAFKDRDARAVERDAVKESMERYEKIQRKAITCLHRREMENRWENFYLKYYLERLAKEVEVSNTDTRRTSRDKFYYDSFNWAASRPWKLFAKDRKLRQGSHGLTEPKPDFVAYFPIYDFNGSEPIWSYDRWQWAYNPKEALVRNFSRKILEHLAQHGLEPSVAGIFRETRRTEIEKSRFMCYPWLIVEHKKANLDKAEACYCQAANAASAALKMHQILAQYAENKVDDVHVPAVTIMTTVGQVVRVWIAYVSNRGKDYEMVCIWKGDTTKLMDIIKLEAILENLHTWAMRELRPWISTYIDQWLFRFPIHPNRDSTSGSGSAYPLETAPDYEASIIRISSEDPEVPKTSDTSKTSLRDMLRAEHEHLLRKVEALLKGSIDKHALQ